MPLKFHGRRFDPTSYRRSANSVEGRPQSEGTQKFHLFLDELTSTHKRFPLEILQPDNVPSMLGNKPREKVHQVSTLGALIAWIAEGLSIVFCNAMEYYREARYSNRNSRTWNTFIGPFPTFTVERLKSGGPNCSKSDSKFSDY